jgi:23S rRNA G2069 N7-methylase RlmK/C1962 C5-methylase RlmI
MQNLPDQMLQLMSDGAWHPQEELIKKISHRFSATKHVLSKKGYKFEKRHIQGQQYEYRLVVQPRQIA